MPCIGHWVNTNAEACLGMHCAELGQWLLAFLLEYRVVDFIVVDLGDRILVFWSNIVVDLGVVSKSTQFFTLATSPLARSQLAP